MRGKVSESLVEGIDLTPTFVDYYGGKSKPHIIEGRSLEPLLHGRETDWRSYCVSEYDYSTRESRLELGIDQNDARLAMIFDGRWKYVHVEAMRPMLFDLENDPDELTDLGADPAYSGQTNRLRELHFDWTRQHHNRTTRSAEKINQMAAQKEPPGIIIGYTDKEELATSGRPLPPHVAG